MKQILRVEKRDKIEGIPEGVPVGFTLFQTDFGFKLLMDPHPESGIGVGLAFEPDVAKLLSIALRPEPYDD